MVSAMRILLDSSVLIEFEKGNRPELLEQLLASSHQLYINPIIVSEYLFHLLAILGERSPLAISESKKVAETLASHQTDSFLSLFSFLPTVQDASLQTVSLMKRYNLLPNDALILSSCLAEKVAVLASFDSDFLAACKSEGVKVIQDISEI